MHAHIHSGTLSTIAYSQYTSEMGGKPTMAVTISMVMIAISMLALLIQRRILAKQGHIPIAYRTLDALPFTSQYSRRAGRSGCR